MTPDCIKTGCAFYDHRGGRWAWGDLYQMGDTLTFVAICNGPVHSRAFETAWQEGPEYFGKTRDVETVEYVGEVPFFEKRGVIVMKLENVVFNKALNDYVGN